MHPPSPRPAVAARPGRRLLLLAGLGALAQVLPGRLRAATPELAAALREGGTALLLRHARTVPGTGDPPGFRLEACATQRNLSEAGREQSRRIGQWFAAQGLRPAAVRSSRWCRCLDTARLAFGAVEPWAALDSFFDDRSSEPRQSAALREALAAIGPGRFEVWVTHQVNITALSGEIPAMGEALAIASGRDGTTIRARARFAE
ncbi:histidine phosphatase family protein [Caldimonas tepidiphila]|uniref:histidine phosphatase family protein n=1 Tax=Caldimonas tepidiphila TaxID=2315841 RepID=UPI000E5C2EF5|nr:histidine phosphatase family protein [Caldimonas tepidiphila]